MALPLLVIVNLYVPCPYTTRIDGMKKDEEKEETILVFFSPFCASFSSSFFPLTFASAKLKQILLDDDIVSIRRISSSTFLFRFIVYLNLPSLAIIRTQTHWPRRMRIYKSFIRSLNRFHITIDWFSVPFLRFHIIQIECISFRFMGAFRMKFVFFFCSVFHIGFGRFSLFEHSLKIWRNRGHGRAQSVSINRFINT